MRDARSARDELAIGQYLQPGVSIIEDRQGAPVVGTTIQAKVVPRVGN
jgi:hypothetical protein